MKKFIILFSLLMVFTFYVRTASAQNATPSGTVDPLQIAVVYDLPYPGLLPDNFFYPLKTFRDKVISFFITDSYKQAEFDLLQADKRLVAAEALQKEPSHSDALVSQTVSKGENYFDDAIINITKAKKEGRLVNDFLDKLHRASIKHQQIIFVMQQKSADGLRQDLGDDRTRVQKFAEEVNTLASQK